MHGRLKNISQWFQLATRPILGIDITSTAVKIVGISGSANALCVACYGYEPLPPNAMDGTFIKNMDVVSNAIKNIISRFEIVSKKVTLAVPDSAIISKVVSFPTGLNDEEMEELVFIEAEKNFSYPIEELNFDFEILDHPQKNPLMIDVLIVASRIAQINNRVETVKRAGLDVLIVDVESFAIERAAQQLAKNLLANFIAIIDIDAVSVRLFVLHQTKLIYSREEQFQAQVLFAEKILAKIKRALHFFYSSNQEGSIDHVLLAGDVTQLSGLPCLIQEQLGIRATFANPFAYMALGNKVSFDSLHHDAPSLMVACGLALRNIDDED